GGGSPGVVQGIGTWVSVRDLLQPEIGGGMPVPDRLQMAAGGSESAGSQHSCPVPHRALPGCGGGSVLPVCPQAGRHGGNRPQSSVHRWNQAGKPGRTVYLCMAEKCRKATSPSKGKNEIPDWIDHIHRSALAAGRGSQGNGVCPRKRQPQKPGTAGLGSEERPSGTVGKL